MSNTLRHESWLDKALPQYARLTTAVVSILENLLRERSIEFLAISGRTKDKRSALEKVTRKGYTDLDKQFTDLSGVRVVVFLESDVRRVCGVIQEAFSIDASNSLDKDSLLSADRIGYRSVHYVCDLGKNRALVDEYRSLSNFQFEVQVRTVLQHAWAELTHDRNYKFSGKLPRDLERKLYLYAGLLEVADRGFDETAAAIDSYSKELRERTAQGDFDLEVTSLSLIEFIEQWVEQNKFSMNGKINLDDIGDLVTELHQFGISKISQLNEIALPEYARAANELKQSTTIFGIVRDWMLLNDWRRFLGRVSFSWVMFEVDEETILLRHLMAPDNFKSMIKAFRASGSLHIDDGDDEESCNWI